MLMVPTLELKNENAERRTGSWLGMRSGGVTTTSSMHHHTVNMWRWSFQWPKANYTSFKDQGLPKSNQYLFWGVTMQSGRQNSTFYFTLTSIICSLYKEHTYMAFTMLKIKAKMHRYRYTERYGWYRYAYVCTLYAKHMVEAETTKEKIDEWNCIKLKIIYV